VKAIGDGRASSSGLTAEVVGTLLHALRVDGCGLWRHLPRRSRALRGEAARDEREGIGVRQMARERELDRALQFFGKRCADITYPCGCGSVKVASDGARSF
jgi:hypothetical protein